MAKIRFQYNESSLINLELKARVVKYDDGVLDGFLSITAGIVVYNKSHKKIDNLFMPVQIHSKEKILRLDSDSFFLFGNKQELEESGAIIDKLDDSYLETSRLPFSKYNAKDGAKYIVPMGDFTFSRQDWNLYNFIVDYIKQDQPPHLLRKWNKGSTIKTKKDVSKIYLTLKGFPESLMRFASVHLNYYGVFRTKTHSPHISVSKIIDEEFCNVREWCARTDELYNEHRKLDNQKTPKKTKRRKKVLQDKKETKPLDVLTHDKESANQKTIESKIYENEPESSDGFSEIDSGKKERYDSALDIIRKKEKSNRYKFGDAIKLLEQE